MCQALSWTPGVHQGARTDKDLALWSLIPSRGGLDTMLEGSTGFSVCTV